MATKKKTKKKQPKSKRTSGKKLTPMKNAVEKKLAKKRVTLKKKLAKKNSAPKKVVAKTKAGGKKTTGGKTAGALKKQVQGKSQSVDTVAFALERLGARPGEQSGDLQGLSNVQRADSESVDELLEQGNAFEAEAVKGVEDAGDSDEGEVRTHEVPQDDVPGEYLAKE
jgi:N utilization substance protein A